MGYLHKQKTDRQRWLFVWYRTY